LVDHHHSAVGADPGILGPPVEHDRRPVAHVEGPVPGVRNRRELLALGRVDRLRFVRFCHRQEGVARPP
jgi:hypothetical protein